MAERWVEKHAISQLQAALTVSVILAENLKISHFLAGAKFRRHAVPCSLIFRRINELYINQ